jgi:hypothetical protein
VRHDGRTALEPIACPPHHLGETVGQPDLDGVIEWDECTSEPSTGEEVLLGLPDAQ